MVDSTIEQLQKQVDQLKQQVAALTLQNGEARNTINWQSLEMLKVAQAVHMPVPSPDDKTPAKWKMESLAVWVKLYVDTLVQQRDQFRNLLTDQNSTPP